MRRVYYAYALRIATAQVTLFTLAGVVLGVLLAQALHVAAIVRNVLAVPLGQVPSYLYSALLSTELWTLFLFGATCMLLLSVPVQSWSLRWRTPALAT